MGPPAPRGRPRGRPVLTRLDLDLVVRSHGWYDLPPFAWDEKRRVLTFVHLHRGRGARVAVAQRGEGVEVSAARAPRAAVEAAVRRVLDLDADLAPFHDLCRGHAERGFGWIAERGAGRILRSPTLFEDAVKVLATTNCSWALTRAVVGNLVAAFDRDGAFPDAAWVADQPERALRAEIRLGYRAPFLLAFAARVASGALDLGAWEDAARPDEEVEAAIRGEKGFGPYAADTLGRMLGRHAKLGLDSWSRKKVAQLRFRGRAVRDARVAALYAPFGRWAGLAFWLDVTRDWHAGSDRLWP